MLDNALRTITLRILRGDLALCANSGKTLYISTTVGLVINGVEYDYSGHVEREDGTWKITSFYDSDLRRADWSGNATPAARSKFRTLLVSELNRLDAEGALDHVLLLGAEGYAEYEANRELAAYDAAEKILALKAAKVEETARAYEVAVAAREEYDRLARNKAADAILVSLPANQITG